MACAGEKKVTSLSIRPACSPRAVVEFVLRIEQVAQRSREEIALVLVAVLSKNFAGF